MEDERRSKLETEAVIKSLWSEGKTTQSSCCWCWSVLSWVPEAAAEAAVPLAEASEERIQESMNMLDRCFEREDRGKGTEGSWSFFAGVLVCVLREESL